MTVVYATGEAKPASVSGRTTVDKASRELDTPCSGCRTLFFVFLPVENMSDLKQRLVSLIATHMEVTESQVDSDQSLSSIGVDSLEMVEIVILVEDELSITLPDNLLNKIDSISDLVRVVESVLSMPEPALEAGATP